MQGDHARLRAHLKANAAADAAGRLRGHGPIALGIDPIADPEHVPGTEMDAQPAGFAESGVDLDPGRAFVGGA